MEEAKKDEKTDKEVYDMAEHVELKKVIMRCYGSISLLDQQFNNMLLDPETNIYIIEALRSYLSTFVEYEILHIEDIL